MPFDPNLPQENTPVDAAQMRDQLNGLNDAIANGIAGTSSNSNAVGTLGLAVNNPPTQADVQTIADKIDELINALRR